jgi:CRP/FNR family cyclic AMP-dependent transcriptional regulator
MARKGSEKGVLIMVKGRLGKIYNNGEAIIKQGRPGECFYVVQSGRVEVVQSGEYGEQHLAYLESGDSFGEMAIFEKEVRSATIRAIGEARVLKVDKKTLFRRIQEDPLLAVGLLKKMSHRIRDLSEQLSHHEVNL